MLETMGDRIKKYRLNRKMQQNELADKLGVSKSAVSNWENGISNPGIELIGKIADYFGITPNDLFGYNKEDMENIEQLKVVLKNTGLLSGDDLTEEELKYMIKQIELLREFKK